MACPTSLLPAAAPFFPSSCRRVLHPSAAPFVPCQRVLPPPAAPFQPSAAFLTPCHPFQPSPPRGRALMVKWTPPPPGWFKLNFDGSVHHDGYGRASIGGVIRDNAGRVVIAFAERTDHATIGIVEARALIRGLQLALGLRINRLLVEGNDLVLVQLLCGEASQTRIPVAMEERIVGLLGCFAGRDVQHVYREGNQVADALCRQAYRQAGVWVCGLLPAAVWEKADEDRRGVPHERVKARLARLRTS